MPGPRRAVPTSTYRLQITTAFDLNEAADVVDYLCQLGVDWLYLSPILPSAAGSDHGYDVIAHDTVDPARGGPDALQHLAQVVHDSGGRLLVDIVPNHVGVADAMANAWWTDVLRHGRTSRYADAFDIDWGHGGRLRIPVLGDEDVPSLQVHGDELRYQEHRFPSRPAAPSPVTTRPPSMIVSTTS